MAAFLEAISNLFKQRRTGYRSPSTRAVSTALSGAVMIWTPDGDVVLSPEAARRVGAKLTRLADQADGSIDLSCEGHKND